MGRFVADGPTVHVHLLARVGNAGDRRMLGNFEADERQPAADNRLTAVVAAYDAAANRALGAIVGQTAKTLEDQPRTLRAPPPASRRRDGCHTEPDPAVRPKRRPPRQAPGPRAVAAEPHRGTRRGAPRARRRSHDAATIWRR